MPKSVTSIGDWALAYCEGFSSLDLPDGVTSIGTAAFQGCTNLTHITIPNNVSTIGPQAFSDCSSMESITIGKKVQFIDLYAFLNCTNLKAVNIKDLSAWCGIQFGFQSEDELNRTSNPLSYAQHLYLNGEEIKDTDDDLAKLQPRIELAADIVKSFILAGIDFTMNQYNRLGKQKALPQDPSCEGGE